MEIKPNLATPADLEVLMSSGEKMNYQLRLTKMEMDALRKKSIEINNLRMKNGLRLLDDPKLLHKILEKSIPYARATADGEIWIEAGEPA